MLAPLKDRSILERVPADEAGHDATDALRLENAHLREELHRRTASMRRNAMLTAQKIVDQANEIERLHALCAHYRQCLDSLHGSQPIIDLGRRLMEISAINDRLTEAAQRVWQLDRTLHATHRAYEALLAERAPGR